MSVACSSRRVPQRHRAFQRRRLNNLFSNAFVERELSVDADDAHPDSARACGPAAHERGNACEARDRPNRNCARVDDVRHERERANVLRTRAHVSVDAAR